MAAGEEQGDPVVGAAAFDRRLGPGCQGLLPAAAPDQVERVALCGRGQPGDGPVRSTVAAPGRQGLDDRALYRLLCDVEIAEAAVQGGDQATGLLAERGR